MPHLSVKSAKNEHPVIIVDGSCIGTRHTQTGHGLPNVFTRIIRFDRAMSLSAVVAADRNDLVSPKTGGYVTALRLHFRRIFYPLHRVEIKTPDRRMVRRSDIIISSHQIQLSKRQTMN